ncbi:hypothetical protein ACFMBG_21110 [Leisingera sp. D0M16]
MRGQLSKRKFCGLLQLFELDITVGKTAGLTGLHHDTVLAIYRLLRQRMAELAVTGCPFRGQDNPRKVPVSGPSNGRARETVGGGCHDGFRSYGGLAEASFARRHKINGYWERKHPVYAGSGVHINGIGSFWSYMNRRRARFNGPRRSSFLAFLKEAEFRFSTRGQDLYRILLTSCRMNPLRH